jgi:hypothetical protein
MGFGIGVWSTEREYDSAERLDESTVWTIRWTRGVSRRMDFEAVYEAHEDEALLGSPVDENVIRLYMRYALTSASATQN